MNSSVTGGVPWRVILSAKLYRVFGYPASRGLYLRMMKRLSRPTILLLTFAIAVAAIGTVLWHMEKPAKAPQNGSAGQAQDQKQEQPSFDKKKYSLSDPTSLWVIANKHRPLEPRDYAPELAAPGVSLRLSASDPEMQVAKPVAPALKELFAGAKTAGLNLIVASAYRSYATQVSVYGAEVQNNGQQAADRESARPGYSEHQTGLAVDVGAASRQCEVEQCFGDMPEGKWIAANAYKYGFVLRYSQGNESTTGYTYEPWHLRYVGNELAEQVHKDGNPPLETFFGLGPAPNYP